MAEISATVICVSPNYVRVSTKIFRSLLYLFSHRLNAVKISYDPMTDENEPNFPRVPD
jgi:hypothetical protein